MWLHTDPRTKYPRFKPNVLMCGCLRICLHWLVVYKPNRKCKILQPNTKSLIQRKARLQTVQLWYLQLIQSLIFVEIPHFDGNVPWLFASCTLNNITSCRHCFQVQIFYFYQREPSMFWNPEPSTYWNNICPVAFIFFISYYCAKLLRGDKGQFDKKWLPLISAWISNYIQYMKWNG